MTAGRAVVEVIVIGFLLYVSVQRMRGMKSWIWKVLIGLVGTIVVMGGGMVAVALSTFPDHHPTAFSVLLCVVGGLFVVGVLVLRVWMLKRMAADGMDISNE